MAESPKLRTFRECVMWPALAATLPWRQGFRLLNLLARRSALFDEALRPSLRGAASLAVIDDESEWSRRYRLIRLVDHCDLYLARTRSNRWLDRYIDQNGRWPETGPFLAMTFHWGAGLWSLAHLHRTGRPVRLVAVRNSRADFGSDWVAYRYANLRNATVERVSGAPEILTGGASGLIRQALANGEVVVALYDIPPDATGSTVRTRLCSRPVDLPAGMARMAIQSGVPVVPFAMGVDCWSGRRRLEIGEAFMARSEQMFADRLADMLSRLIASESAAWHFCHLVDRFFGVEPPLADSEARVAVQA